MGRKYASDVNEPRRDMVRHAQPEIAPAPRSKKNTKRWCRGKVGAEHQPAVRLQRSGWAQRNPCRWHVWYRGGRDNPRAHYSCRHEIACADCGKITQHWLRRSECPDYHDNDTGVPLDEDWF